jgi:hypothetical protein
MCFGQKLEDPHLMRIHLTMFSCPPATNDLNMFMKRPVRVRSMIEGFVCAVGLT